MERGRPDRARTLPIKDACTRRCLPALGRWRTPPWYVDRAPNTCPSTPTRSHNQDVIEPGPAPNQGSSVPIRPLGMSSWLTLRTEPAHRDPTARSGEPDLAVETRAPTRRKWGPSPIPTGTAAGECRTRARTITIALLVSASLKRLWSRSASTTGLRHVREGGDSKVAQDLLYIPSC